MPWFDTFEKLGGLFGWSVGMHRTGGDPLPQRSTMRSDANQFDANQFMAYASSYAGPSLPRLAISASLDRLLSEDESVSAKFDHWGRPHCGVGPAVEISNGEEQFFWHGVRVPELVVMEPAKITVEMIEIESNAEIRRVLIERYGTVRYMQDCGAKLIHEDETGHLYCERPVQKYFIDQRFGSISFTQEEPLCMVKVKNSTPELDGSFKDYWLRVPPTMKTAREAVAWTFWMDEKKYQPALET